jgi:hypothetical protein
MSLRASHQALEAYNCSIIYLHKGDWVVKKILSVFILIIPYQVNAAGDPLAQETYEIGEEMGPFGIGPAFYMIRYNEEILPEYYDTAGVTEAAVVASGSQYATEVGLELHYNYAFASGRCCLGLPIVEGAGHGFSASPFLGLYDFDDGVDGIILGATFGYYRRGGDYKIKPSLNLGIGYTVHMDQLVVADGVAEGAGFAGDYIERKDVGGWALTLSTSINF